MKKLLILGGTNFIGRNLVEQLLKENIYEIFLFNRQLSNAKLFPTINKIKGDRETDEINQISNHQWDFVIDLSCYFPQDLEATIKNLKGQNLRYLLISSCSVYNSKNLKEMKTENAEQLNCSTFEKTDRTDLSYGNRKAECERILKRSGHNYSILRPALVFGKYDSSDRFYYWLYQVKMKNQILIPENGLGNFSITYVEDLVSAIVNSLKQDTHSKTYNIITDPRSSIKKIVEEGNSIMSKKINPINASSSFLDANNIHEWLDLPLWLKGNHFTYSNSKALDAGLYKPSTYSDSLKECISYFSRLNWPIPKFGIPESRQTELLDKLNSEI